MSIVVDRTIQQFSISSHLSGGRQIENDLPTKEDGWKFPAQRIYEISVPLLMLYKPISKYISMGMGGFRLVTHLAACVQAGQKQEKWKLASETSQVVLAGISFASFFFHLPMGAYVTTAADILKNLSAIISHYRAQEPQERDLIKDDLIQLVGSSFYMAVMLTCSANILLASIVVQGTINLYQASKNWRLGKTPEVLVQFVVAGVRFHEAKKQWELIQWYNAFAANLKAAREQAQNDFKKYQELAAEKKLQEEKSASLSQELSLDKNDQQKIDHPTEPPKKEISQVELSSDPVFKRLAQKVATCKAVEHLCDSPLQNLEGKIKENQLVMQGAPGESFKGGVNFHSYGKGGIVKGTNLHFQKKTVDGKEATVLDFKVNHVFRDRMEPRISELREMSNHPHLNEMLALTGSEIKGIHIGERLIDYGTNRLHEITLNGLGTLYVGPDPKYAGLYDQIIVKVDTNPEIEKFHQILSFLDLQDALKPCSADDIERFKIGLLFRSFSPREATLLERTEEFFTLSIEKLKDLIIQKAPKMSEIFPEFLSKMEPYEIVPGRIRYRISGLAQKCHDAGGRALIHAIGGEGYWERGNEERDFNHLISIMNMGLLSSETRRVWGMDVDGGPSDGDLWSNRHWDGEEYLGANADSVFARLMTKENCSNSELLKNYTYIGQARCGIIISLDSLETGTYQYHSQEENAGYRVYAPYLNRKSILEFIQEELMQFNGDNEVMLKERVSPSMFRAIVFTDQELRNRFVDYLRSMRRIKIDETGEEKLDGHSLERFIRYATNVSEELISK
jgi:hypothetical protein